MSYAIKEMHYTLQGEGALAGRAAVFLRFAGCNLWSGREEDRDKGKGGCARWCDTDFVGTDGHRGGKFDDAEAVGKAVLATWKGPITSAIKPLVVCTGGEPMLQLDEDLILALTAQGFEVAVETNGTQKLGALRPHWVTLSPKPGGELALASCDELKLIYPQEEWTPERFVGFPATYRFLQPMDGPKQAENIQATIEYIRSHPEWRLSLQTHKIVGLP